MRAFIVIACLSLVACNKKPPNTVWLEPGEHTEIKPPFACGSPWRFSSTVVVARPAAMVVDQCLAREVFKECVGEIGPLYHGTEVFEACRAAANNLARRDPYFVSLPCREFRVLGQDYKGEVE